jgi:hypothetical protein
VFLPAPDVRPNTVSAPLDHALISTGSLNSAKVGDTSHVA